MMNTMIRPAVLAAAFAALAAAALADEPTDETLRNAAASGADWLTHGRDYAETRHSPLDAIRADNVAELGLVWQYDTGMVRGHEATPIVADGVLYATTAWSNVFALDAASGEVLWQWDARADRVRGSRACCDVVNRGVALYDGKVYVGVIDGRLVALDAGSGAPVWDVRTAPADLPYTITGAPRVVDGKVVIGNGGAELGARGFVSAYDAQDGELLWRFYTVPGDPSKPFENAALEAAAETWTGEWWKMGGGGTAWDGFAYDPQARLLYVGTGNGSPWDRNARSPDGGDNLYISSILALDVDTGELVWHYQTTPGDTWDYTAVQQLTLAELTIDGETRQVIMQAPKNGFFYVLDRLTGELLSAEPFAHVTWARGVDPATGRPIETAHARYGEALSQVSPGPPGAHSWQPMSFNPATGLVYLPALENSFMYGGDTDYRYRRDAWNLGIDLAAAFGTKPGKPALPQSAYEPGTGEPLGAPSVLLAWDPVEQHARWRVPYADTDGGGTLTTAGNLVFQGTDNGRFIAYRADTGEKLWEVDIGHPIMAAPVTYEVDGRQYVTVLSGMGGAGGLYGRNPTGQYKSTGHVWTFALGGDAPIEPVIGQPRPRVTAVPLNASAEQLAAGAVTYHQNCSMCHGVAVASGGGIADLRYAAPATYDDLEAIVRDGAYAMLGMPQFGWLTDDELAAVKAYVISQRNALVGD